MRKIRILFSIVLFSTTLNAQSVKVVTVTETVSILKTLDKANSVIIDGRNTAMYGSGHIKNAINIDAFGPDAVHLLSNYLVKDIIVVYCTHNNRSGILIDLLGSLDFEGEIIEIAGGITDWKEKGFKLISN